MKIVAVIGTKKTGKTTLMTKLISKLVERGFRVGALKHAHGSFDLAGKDTWKYKEVGAQVIVGSSSETFFLINKEMELEEILERIESIHELDFLLIEGFKSSYYPKISVTDFLDEYTIAQVDPLRMEDEKISELMDIIEERSYGRIPHMNCQECGYSSCLDLAKNIIQGKAQEDMCVMKKEKDVQLKIDGKNISLNPFVQKFVKNVIMGMINSLKTDEKGKKSRKIEIMINDENH